MPAFNENAASRFRARHLAMITAFMRVGRGLVLNVGHIVRGRKGKRGKSTTKGKGSRGGGIRTMQQRARKRATMLARLILKQPKEPTPQAPQQATGGKAPPKPHPR